MHKGVIIVQAPNKLIEDEFLQIATGERDTYAGFILPSKEGLMTAHIRPDNPNAASTELAQIVRDTNAQLKAEDKTKDSAMVLFLASTDATHDDDLQPHVLLKDMQGKTLLACFLEGEFEEEFENLSSSSPTKHTPEFFAVQTYLVPKISGIHHRTNDLSKTIDELKYSNKEIVKSLRKDSKSRMVLTFVSSTGEIFSMKQNENEKVFPWGYVSQAFGYEEKTATPLVSSKSVFATPSSPTPPTPVQPEPSAIPDNLPAGPNTSVPVVPQKDDPIAKWKETLFVPGPTIDKKRHVLKGWYKHWGGDQILGELDKIKGTNGSWHDGSAKFKVRAKVLDKVDKALEDGIIAVWDPKPIASVEPITQVAPAVITSTSDDKKIIPMIIKPEGRQKIEVLLPRVIAIRDEKGQHILNPEKLAEFEKNIPTLAEQLGKPAGTFLPIDPEGYDLIEALEPGAVKRLFFENQAMLAASQKRIIELETSLQTKSKSAFA